MHQMRRNVEHFQSELGHRRHHGSAQGRECISRPIQGSVTSARLIIGSSSATHRRHVLMENGAVCATCHMRSSNSDFQEIRLYLFDSAPPVQLVDNR
mmetsp:Transcript_95236/g.183650  ORF Transcript_95236/g.183650 Transcript_95236/m.183650 type:complete len:97 (-) Transcript_95236:160-450(-)